MSTMTKKMKLAMNVTQHVLASGVHMKAHVKQTATITSHSVIYVPIVSVHYALAMILVMTDFVETTLSTLELYVNVSQALLEIS